MSTDALSALDKWFLSPQGLAVARAFSDHTADLGSLLCQLRGQNFLQIGAAGTHEWVKYFQYKDYYLLSSDAPNKEQPGCLKVYGLPSSLPFAANVFDCIVSPLSLHVCDNVTQMLNELDRVLKPQGYLVIYGVNSLSLWSVAMRLGLVPHLSIGNMHSLSLLRIKNLLLHFNYVIHHLDLFYYIPPVNNAKWINRLEIFNELGKMISPCPSGFYCMVVQKNVSMPISWVMDPSYEPMAASLSN